MASVKAINSSSLSVRDLFASAANSSASVDTTKQFDSFLQSTKSVQNTSDTSAATNNTKAQDTAIGNSQSYSKRDELLADKTNVSDRQSKLSGEEAENLASMQQELRDIVKDTLDIDDETLDSALESMGIVLTNLLQPEVLQQFVLLVNGGEESTDFLTNEDLMQNFTDLLANLEDFQAENQDTMLALMETLETPVLLDEFLQQEGISPDDFALSAEDFNSVPGEVQETVSEESQIGAGVGKTEENQSDVEDVNTLISHSEDTEGTVEVKVVSQNAKDTGAESEEDTTEQEDSELFFSQSEDISEEKTVAEPLFAEQFNTLQKDGIQFIEPQLNSTQRMQQMIDIVNQVSETIRSAVNADTTSVEIQLNPESLGKVFLSVVSKGGVMTANFHVQTEEAKNALESQILLLRDNLEAKNLKVESVEVHVSDFSFDQSNQAEGQSQEEMAKQSRRKFRYDTEDNADTEQDVEVSAEQVRRQVMRDNGGSIDFTA